MEYSLQFHKLCQVEARRYILLVALVAITYLMLQSVMLSYGGVLKSFMPDNKALLNVKSDFPSSRLSVESKKDNEFDPTNLDRDQSNANVLIGYDDGSLEMARGIRDKIVKSKGNSEDETHVLIKQGEIGPSDFVRAGKHDDQSNTTMFIGSNEGLKERDKSVLYNLASERNVQDEALRTSEDKNNKFETSMNLVMENSSIPKPERSLELNRSSDGNQNRESGNQGDYVLLESQEELPESDLALFRNELDMIHTQHSKVKDRNPPVSVTPIYKMNQLLLQYFASSTNTKSQFSSLRDRDKEILDAKLKIINSAASNVDKELYAPVFRNVSMFMRSYELMEQTLKVYVYRDGKKPIFHQPILKGLYASEGWFMKLMEGNKHFLVKRPERAHLFYMPFSSRELEHSMYIPDSRNRTSLTQFVKHYKETIASKYPFWNRTGGTDHFFAACHDWAPFETTEHLENSIKALCNADVTIGFRIGKDVSLPETFIRYARNPLRYRGGKPPSERKILAFYAGNRHGYLRPILLKYWKDKDPDMRIYGLLPSSVSRRMNYIQHMKSSKYCICPKGFEVNSPRVVEAIFYECVPVIISDNFVPPLFDVLNWEAFALIIAEKDIPNLKNILLSIPENKYIELQMGVRKVQQHFLWHARPVKYDLFHMILHSIWFSRVFQM